MKWSECLPQPVRYIAGTAIILSYIAREAIEFARLPRSERERLIDMVLDAVSVGAEQKKGDTHGS